MVAFGMRFQSTLPSEKESDLCGCAGWHPNRSFNPRSPPKRRATPKPDRAEPRLEVSIHAPLRKGERHVARNLYRTGIGFNPRSPPKRRATRSSAQEIRLPGFQSTLPSEKESDELPRPFSPRRNGFNPRSPPKRRATTPQIGWVGGLCRFNPRSPPKRRATGVREVC